MRCHPGKKIDTENETLALTRILKKNFKTSTPFGIWTEICPGSQNCSVSGLFCNFGFYRQHRFWSNPKSNLPLWTVWNFLNLEISSPSESLLFETPYFDDVQRDFTRIFVEKNPQTWKIVLRWPKKMIWGIIYADFSWFLTANQLKSVCAKVQNLQIYLKI